MYVIFSIQFVDTQENGNGNTSLVSKQFFNNTKIYHFRDENL
jgi:hypothetical protein